MSAAPEVVAARARAAAARARFDASIELAKQRLSPRSLASNAVEGAKDKAVEVAQSGLQAARDRPGATAAVIGAVGLALAHKPIVGWIRHFTGRDDDDATAADDAS